MSDDLKQRGPQDRSRVNLHEQWELTFWMDQLRISEEQLKEAVAAVGNSATRVREYIYNR
jgi:hypothetical protein